VATTVPPAPTPDSRVEDAPPLSAIEFEATDAVREALASMGRTEDVRLAPDGRRLALACYARDQIAVADVEISRSEEVTRVAVTAVELLASPLVREPHGVDWRDPQTLVVANRGGGVAVLRLTRDGLVPLGTGGATPSRVDAPGSVAVQSVGNDRHEVFACNNWANTVTRHGLDAGGVLTDGSVAVRKWLDLPDGVAMSSDRRWLAVSNHNTHSVLIYDAQSVDEHADPAGILRGVQYPHGLRFGGADSRLLVADAGAPHVHVFVRPGPSWSGVAYPAATVKVMDDDTFAQGHVNPQEGGPKGIDLDPRAAVLVVTSHYVPLAFFDVADVLEDPRGFVVDGQALIRYELDRLAAIAEAKKAVAEAKGAAAEANAALHAVYRTKTWRLTALPRRLYAGLRRTASRDSTVSRGMSCATSSGASATARSESSA
jgi:hypothetical protein